ncbi:lycopene cyclase domain-containing protein [Rudaeicoccus suwonensis]|uniref:Lycopene cyclase domain-containing protein n=1 Tax=Rudaeicoccus suwonensis TaxID=657409 RepID=A0A561EBL4_9MICO|nr:lycopene cyclase domain-containing protein [Rudaeicoccus suwonensis]TWE13001.1 lycopene cyclase domain-containing protein [Rudaeicoccus suwonensis]
MSYTALAALAVVVALCMDWVVLRTRVTATRRWWSAYAIVLVFQLVTNGWLTGRRIVTYDPRAIIGSGQVRFIGDGRLVFAPVEDLGFGFALALASVAWWCWWNRRLGATEE